MTAYSFQPQVERKLSSIAHRIARDYVSVVRSNYRAWVRDGMEKTVADYGIPMKLSALMHQRSIESSIADDLGRMARTVERMKRIEFIAKEAIKTTLQAEPELALHLSALRMVEAERALANDRAEQAEEAKRNAPLGAFLFAALKGQARANG